MRRMLFLLLFAFFASIVNAQKPEVISIKAAGDTAMIFTVTTQTYGGQFSPKHCLAIWITDANDVFKRTLKLAASTYKVHLVKWNQMSSGNVTNAITGSSMTTHTTHTVYWDGKDKNGTLLPDGNYKVYIEFTESNSAQPSIPDGPWTSFTFTKGTSQIQNPTDVNYNYNGQNKIVYKNITIQTFGTSSISSILKGGNVEIFPNPTNEEAQIKVNLPYNTDLNVAIYSIDGKLIHQFPAKTYEAGQHIFFWYPASDNAKTGTYFVRISSGKEFATYKLIVK